MFNIDIDALKSGLKNVYDLFDTIENSGLDVKPDGLDLPLKEIFKMDALKMILYFSASDGKLSNQEVSLINEVFGLNATAQNYIDIIKRYNIYSTKFENDDPLSLQIIKLFEQKVGALLKQSSLPVLIGFLENVAKAVINIDNDIDNRELDDFNIYFTNLKQKYIENSFVSLGETFKKNTSSSSAGSNTLKDYYLKKKN